MERYVHQRTALPASAMNLKRRVLTTPARNAPLQPTGMHRDQGDNAMAAWCQSLLHRMPDLIIIFGRAGIVRYVQEGRGAPFSLGRELTSPAAFRSHSFINPPAAAKILGRRSEEIVGKHISEVGRDGSA